MSKGKVIVGANGGNTIIDDIIKDASDSNDLNVTHSFGLIFDSILESRGVKEANDPYPGVWLHSPSKYAEDSTARMYEVEVPDIEALESEARKLIGSFYSIGSCLAYVLKKLTNINVPDFARTCDCCELWITLLRSGGLTVLPQYKVNQVSPKLLTTWLIAHGTDVTEEYRDKYGKK